MATAIKAVDEYGYSSRAQKVLIIDDSGTPSNNSLYEYSELSVPASTTDYDVTATGGMFGTVTTAKYIQITNSDTTYDIVVKLNSTSNDGITIAANGGQLVLDSKINVTNLYITTVASHSGTTDILLLGR